MYCKMHESKGTVWLHTGRQEYHELTVQQRVQIAVLLCNFTMSSNSIRTQLDEAEDNRKEMRKELVHLRAKLKRYCNTPIYTLTARVTSVHTLRYIQKFLTIYALVSPLK